MGIKTLKPAPDPLAFIAGASKPEPVSTPKPEDEESPKSKKRSKLKGKDTIRLIVYVDDSLDERIDRECKRRGGVGRSTLLKLLAAEHLPE